MQNALSRGLRQLDLSLDRATQEKLCAFGQAVIAQNEVMNLTAIKEPEQVAILRLADCVSLLKVADLKGKRLIDVGCGAGFPGVPLKIACPELDLTLLDSLGKRMHWLEEIHPTLGVEASYIIGRAEEALEGRR